MCHWSNWSMLSKYSSGLASFWFPFQDIWRFELFETYFDSRMLAQDNPLPLRACVLPWRHWACRSTAETVSAFQASSNLYSMTWLPTKACADSSLSKQSFREVRGHSTDYFGGRRGRLREIAVLLNPACFTEARAWHIWVIKYKDSLLKNYASKTFSDHT